LRFAAPLPRGVAGAHCGKQLALFLAIVLLLLDEPFAFLAVFAQEVLVHLFKMQKIVFNHLLVDGVGRAIDIAMDVPVTVELHHKGILPGQAAGEDKIHGAQGDHLLDQVRFFQGEVADVAFDGIILVIIKGDLPFGGSLPANVITILAARDAVNIPFVAKQGIPADDAAAVEVGVLVYEPADISFGVFRAFENLFVDQLVLEIVGADLIKTELLALDSEQSLYGVIPKRVASAGKVYPSGSPHFFNERGPIFLNEELDKLKRGGRCPGLCDFCPQGGILRFYIIFQLVEEFFLTCLAGAAQAGDEALRVEACQIPDTQNMLDDIAEKYNRPHRKTNALLSGLVYCPICGKRLRVVSESNRWTNGKPRFKYVCPGYRENECTFQAVDGVLLDEFVVKQLSNLSDEDSEYFTELLNQRASDIFSHSQNEQELSELKKKKTQLETAISNQVKNMRDSSDDLKRFIQEDIQDLSDELREVGILLEKLEDSKRNQMYAVRNIEEIKEKLLSFGKYAEDAQPDVLVTLIQSFVERIYNCR